MTREDEIRQIKQFLLMLLLVIEVEEQNDARGSEWAREAQFYKKNLEARLDMFERLPGEKEEWPLHERVRCLSLHLDVDPNAENGTSVDSIDLVLAADVIRDYERLNAQSGNLYDDRLEGRAGAGRLEDADAAF